MTNLEVKFKEWEWEEGLHVLTLEDVGLGKTFKESSIFITFLLSALIIYVVGLGISTIVFMIEKLIDKMKKKEKIN